MYVRWKMLISLGAIFWCLSCLKEYFWTPPKTELGVGWREPEIKTILEPKEETMDLIKIIFWNFVAFISTLSVCFALKSLAKLWWSRRDLAKTYEDGVILLRRNHSSKIPIPITAKSSSTDIHVEGVSVILSPNDDGNKSCPNLKAGEKSKNEELKLNRVWSIRNMEKHCAKLREEMINLQASSLKEHSSISKKMDALAKEKREFIHQLNLLHKENKLLKQKVEEMLEERTLLVKQLDSASKQIRVNTRSKKSTLAKLEEALANAEILKSNLKQISKDKLVLETKLMQLDAEYNRLKQELEAQKSETQFSAGPVNITTESQIIFPKETDDFDIVQTEVDMKKVQQKLMNLEKSLEGFKFRPTKEESSDVLQQGQSIREEPSTISICTERDCPLEHRDCTSVECFLKNTDFSSGDESLSVFSKPEKENLSPKRRLVQYIKSSISDDRLSVISERAITTGEESGEDYEPQRRISESPQFQKFLKKVIDPPPVDSQFKLKLESALTNYCGV